MISLQNTKIQLQNRCCGPGVPPCKGYAWRARIGPPHPGHAQRSDPIHRAPHEPAVAANTAYPVLLRLKAQWKPELNSPSHVRTPRADGHPAKILDDSRRLSNPGFARDVDQ
jgi:hypothetical protein